ncbi:MAG: YfhO family protein [Candidatus Omnitrophica bacterium]|nr:YfhO family protein [Candidatus Omnitrophota bacterium]
MLPLWDPFVMWGTPTQIFLNYVGIFNPFWLLINIFNVCGLSFYLSFVYTIALYFWLGQIGFYLLAKIIFKDSRMAYVAFLLFLFSCLSLSVFAQYHPPLLYIPGTWFFYFVLSFFQKPSRWTWTGLTLTAGIILTTYLPFYFITVFVLVGVLIVGFYLSTVVRTLPIVGQFFRKNSVLIVLSFGVLFLAFMPGVRAYQSTVKKEIVAPFRYEEVEKRSGVDFSKYEQVAKNGFATRMDFKDLYEDLDIITYGDDCFFYVSIFLYLLIFLGVFVRVSRIMAICVLTALPLFFLILTVGSGFHRFVFEHVFYFKLIRNMHFFLPFFLAAMVLLATEQFRVIFDNRKVLTSKYRTLFLLHIVVVHAGLAIFLREQQNIVFSSYLTIALSFLFWLTFVFQKRSYSYLLSILLFLCIMVQPVEVVWHHNQRALSLTTVTNKNVVEDCIKSPSVKPVFAYVRPIADHEVGNDDTARARITMTDTSRFYGAGFPIFWSYDLSLKESFDDIQQFTKYKFYIYDNQQRAISVLEPSEQFAVTDFDTNSLKIKTNYLSEKFLVYTDSFHDDWKAYVNGRITKIHRVHTAFKGISLPAGPNEVVFRYSPSGVVVMSFAVSVAFLFLAVLMIWFWRKEKYGKD